MITIYHNPSCGKSREGLKLLEASLKEFKVVFYLKDRLNKAKLNEILLLLNKNPKDIVRKNEPLWKEYYKDKTFSDDELIDVLIENPKLIERPIVINKDVGVIGRPTEKILEII
ncbi:MAG: arsenate reductase (glutaredoxin) [Solirubrobacteraceae bacterium]